MLSRIVSDDWGTLKDPSGSYLIDRPPEYFAPVLHYLRSGSLGMQRKSEKEKRRGEKETLEE